MKRALLLLIFLNSSLAFGKLNVVTTTPDLAWLVKEIGKEKVNVASLLNGTEDPHYVDAMPHWIAKVSKADIFCFVGMELEVGWAPKIMTRSGNAKIQSGGKGHCDAGKSVHALEVPTGKIDRSMGDIHSGGNPHYHLSPAYFMQAGDSVLSTFLDVDPKEAEYYLNNFENLKAKMKALSKKVSSILMKKKGLKIISYHKEFSYFFKEFGLSDAGEIEEKPGIPPSAGRIARVALSAKKENVHLAMATTANPKKILDKFHEISGVPVAIVPLSIVKSGTPSDYEQLITELANKIVEKAKL